ncbi:MAG: SHOCT domain-containing protein [Eubacterium sp.]|nr:SHOCT domain-containing protein [Eubacterium sp.]
MPFSTYGLMHLFEGEREHSVVIGKAAYRTLRQAIREVGPLLGKPEAGSKTETVSRAGGAPASDPYEEVKKLKELLDMEIITPEEFDRKKKQLLDL